MLTASVLICVVAPVHAIGQEQKSGQKKPNATSRQPTALKAPLTVLNYNVWNGFDRGNSYDSAVAWVKKLDPEIAGWQELVRWNENRLKKAALDWNHPFAATLKQGGYNIGLTSKTPIEVIARKTAGFHHGYLHCRTAGIDVIVCHLWPGKRTEQMREAKLLRNLVNRLDKEGKHVLLMGDFNAHSMTDESWLNQQKPLIERRLPVDEKKSAKDRFIRNGKYVFDIMDLIQEAPLRDIVFEKFRLNYPEPTKSQRLQLGSFPTRVLDHVKTPETQSGFLERIDFILATSGLADQCDDARVCRNEEVLDTISDHYPVVASFGKKVSEPEAANQK